MSEPVTRYINVEKGMHEDSPVMQARYGLELTRFVKASDYDAVLREAQWAAQLVLELLPSYHPKHVSIEQRAQALRERR